MDLFTRWCFLGFIIALFTFPPGITSVPLQLDKRQGWSAYPYEQQYLVAADSSFATLSRNPDNMELFWIGPDSSVQHNWFDPATGWLGASLTGRGTAEGGIAAVSRTPDHMQAWWAATSGAIYQASWTAATSWRLEGVLVEPVSGLAWGAVTALKRVETTDHMEVLWAASDGTIRHKYWYGSSGWSGVAILAPATRNAEPTPNSLVSISASYSHMAAYWIASDGSIRYVSWSASLGWTAPAVLVPAKWAALRSRLAVISREESHQELFWITPEGAVAHAFVTSSTGSWIYGRLTAADTARAGGIAAVTRSGNQTMEVYWTSVQGNIHNMIWLDSGWSPVQPSIGRVTLLEGPIGAGTRGSDVIDVFYSGKGGLLGHSGWVA